MHEISVLKLWYPSGGIKVGILGSQFMEKLETTGYSGVGKWHRNVSFFLR